MKRKKYWMSATKIVYYKEEFIEAATEACARAEFKSGIENGLVGIREIDLDIDCSEEVEDEEEQIAEV